MLTFLLILRLKYQLDSWYSFLEDPKIKRESL